MLAVRLKPRLLAAITPVLALLASSAAAEMVTYRVRGEVDHIRREYNGLLTSVIPLVVLHPIPEVVSDLGLEGFDRPRSLMINPDGTFSIPGDTTALPRVSIDFTVTIDLSDPTYQVRDRDVFVAVESSAIQVGGNEFMFDDLSVVLKGFDPDSKEVSAIDLVPGILEPPSPPEFSTEVFQASASFVEHNAYMPWALAGNNETQLQAAHHPQRLSRFYLTGEVVDHAIGFAVTSITVVPEPGTAMLFSLAMTSWLGLGARRRG